MSTPDHQPPVPDASRPETKDRIYRSPAGIAGGVLLLLIAVWLGVDALISGHGRTPWLALAALILVVPLVSAFTLRPAVYANEDRLRIRNPFRVIVLPWSKVAALRSGFSNEVVDTSGTKYQLWSVPVSLRARKRVAKQQTRGASAGGGGRMSTLGRISGTGRPSAFGGASSAPVAPSRATTDQIMEDLRELSEARAASEGAQGEISVRWAYEVMGPAVAGAVLLAILIAVG
ncbi:PH domain-containing protein [Streptomyces sp. NPDC048309]|uniref:PH domain-containing protein n=1 Tax=unclassified Streptomyces TaxID=2593676 RepID=UPI00340F83B3